MFRVKAVEEQEAKPVVPQCTPKERSLQRVLQSHALVLEKLHKFNSTWFRTCYPASASWNQKAYTTYIHIYIIIYRYILLKRHHRLNLHVTTTIFPPLSFCKLPLALSASDVSSISSNCWKLRCRSCVKVCREALWCFAKDPGVVAQIFLHDIVACDSNNKESAKLNFYQNQYLSQINNQCGHSKTRDKQ